MKISTISLCLVSILCTSYHVMQASGTESPTLQFEIEMDKIAPPIPSILALAPMNPAAETYIPEGRICAITPRSSSAASNSASRTETPLNSDLSRSITPLNNPLSISQSGSEFSNTTIFSSMKYGRVALLTLIRSQSIPVQHISENSLSSADSYISQHSMPNSMPTQPMNIPSQTKKIVGFTPYSLFNKK